MYCTLCVQLNRRIQRGTCCISVLALRRLPKPELLYKTPPALLPSLSRLKSEPFFLSSKKVACAREKRDEPKNPTPSLELTQKWS